MSPRRLLDHLPDHPAGSSSRIIQPDHPTGSSFPASHACPLPTTFSFFFAILLEMDVSLHKSLIFNSKSSKRQSFSFPPFSWIQMTSQKKLCRSDRVCICLQSKGVSVKSPRCIACNYRNGGEFKCGGPMLQAVRERLIRR